MEIKTKELLNSINKVQAALKDGKLIEFKGLLIFNGKNLMSYGDDISVSVPLKTDFIGAVEEDKPKKLIQKIPNETVIIEKEGDQLLINADEMKSGFSLIEYNEESVPDMGLGKIKRWFNLPDDFIESLKFCIFSASNNDAAGFLCNLKIEPERILSSDNYRIMEKNLSSKILGSISQENGLLIPRKTAVYLSGFKLVKYAITETCAHYKDEDGVVFSHRLIADEYPAVDEYLDIEGQNLELPKNLAGALSRAQAIVSKEEDKVTVSLEKGNIEISAEGKRSWLKEPVDSDYKGEDLKFDVSPDHMLQILEYSTKSVIGENALLFTGDNFRQSICLIDDETEATE